MKKKKLMMRKQRKTFLVLLCIKMLIQNHEAANRGIIKGHLPLQHLFGFCKSFTKVTKNLGFRITFKTANLQDIFYTTIADAIQINITINS